MHGSRLGKTTLAALAVLALSLPALWLLRGLLTLTPWTRTVALEAPSAVTATDDGGCLVIDRGSRRVLRLDGSGRCAGFLEATDDEAKSFQYALDARAAPDGGLYLRDVVWQDNGMDVAMERIFYRESPGEPLRAVFTLDGAADGRTRHKPRLWGPFLSGGGACFVQAEGDAVTVRLLPDGEAARTLSYPDAETGLSDIAMDGGGRLCLVDKRGLILREEADGTFAVLYRGGGVLGEKCSVPWDMAVSENGLVFADLGSRSIRRLTPEGAETVLEPDGERPVTDAPILYQVDLSGDGRVLLACGDSIYIQGPDGTVQLHTDTLPLTDGLMLQRWCAFFALVLAVLSGTTAAACLTACALRRFRPGLGTKVGALVLFSMLVATVIVSAVAFRATQARYVEEIFARMQSTAVSAGKLLDMEALEEVRTPEDYGGAAYRRLRASLESAVDRSLDWNRDLYCNIYLYRDGVLFSPIYLDRTTGAFYPLEDEGQREVMETGEPLRFYLSQTSSGTWMYVFSPLYGRDGRAVGVVDVGIDMHAYQKQMRGLYVTVILGVFSACAVVQLLVVQALGVVEFFRARRALGPAKPGRRREPVGFLRPVVFLVFFAFNLPTAFLPNYCADFGAKLFGLPDALLTALPVSLNLLATACGSFGGALAAERLGPRVVGVCGGVLAAGAYLGIAWAGDYLPFTACMALAGLGLGAALGAVNSYIAMCPGGEREEGFSIYNSAYFSGVNCGAVVGALLASVLGERAVFAAVGACMLLPAALLWKWMGGAGPRRSREAGDRGFGLFRFLFTPRILVFLVLGYVPYVVAGHFLFYFLPIFSVDLGLDGTAVSQLFLVNGVCVLLLARFSSEVFLKRMGRGTAARWALLLVGLAFLVFSWRQTLAGVLSALLLLSLADSFGRSAMNLCFSEQELSRRFGGGRAMGVFSLFENIGDTAGPVVFGFLLSGDTAAGFRLLALVYGVCALAFLLPARRKYRGKHLYLK